MCVCVVELRDSGGWFAGKRSSRVLLVRIHLLLSVWVRSHMSKPQSSSSLSRSSRSVVCPPDSIYLSHTPVHSLPPPRPCSHSGFFFVVLWIKYCKVAEQKPLRHRFTADRMHLLVLSSVDLCQCVSGWCGSLELTVWDVNVCVTFSPSELCLVNCWETELTNPLMHSHVSTLIGFNSDSNRQPDLSTSSVLSISRC